MHRQTGVHTKLLNVWLDIGPTVHQRAGLARYAERLAEHLLRLDQQEFTFHLFYNQHSGHRLPSSLERCPAHSVALGQYAWRLSVLVSQLCGVAHPALSRQQPGAQLYHATEHLLPYLHIPTVLTVHDLIFERYPQYHTRSNRLFLKLAMPLFIHAASAVIAVSQCTRRDILERYRTPAEKIHVIYEGIDDAFRPASPAALQTIRQRYSLDRPYLLMVGTLEPRKNHLTALRSLARLKAAGLPHRLVIAGGHGWLFAPIQQAVDSLGLKQDVFFTGYIPFADLAPLYSAADCVLAPSLYEGFGFPVLEAMACGAPVVCSNTSSLVEVAGEAALTVDPLDEQALSQAVHRLVAEPGLANELRRRGIQQAAAFRWEKCAQQTVELYLGTAEK